MTRLLKTPIIGRLTAPVASSCIDIEAGLSKCDMIRTPPDFCASATGAVRPSDNAHAVANLPRFCFIAVTSPGWSHPFSSSGSDGGAVVGGSDRQRVAFGSSVSATRQATTHLA